jgi:hypothetical protein
MLSAKSNATLLGMYEIHRAEFMELNPGCNENDSERDFLYKVLTKVSSHAVTFSKISDQIETIR